MFYFMVFATVVAAVGAWTDFRTGHIPNALTLGALPLAIAGHAVHGFVVHGAKAGLIEGAFAALGAVLCGLLPLFMFVKGGMGGGDVKLFAVIGAACLPMGGFEAETYAFVCAGVMAPAQLVYRGVLTRTLGGVANLFLNPFRPAAKRVEVPEELRTWFRLGPAIFAGTLVELVTHGKPL